MSSYKIKNVFLTGIDENTDLDRILSLTKQHPYVVWGVLISDARQGTKNNPRYPSYNYIKRLKTFIEENNLRNNFSIHICGSQLVNDFFVSTFNTDRTTLTKEYFNYFKYIQINFNMKVNSLYQKAIWLAHCSQPNDREHSRIIVQYNENNDLGIFHTRINHGNRYSFFDELIDFSGGNGLYKSPSEILDNYYTSSDTFGIAGGFGPDNIKDIIHEIENYNNKTGIEYNVWIDMETKIRTNDLLDLDKCEYVLNEYKNNGKYHALQQK